MKNRYLTNKKETGYVHLRMFLGKLLSASMAHTTPINLCLRPRYVHQIWLGIFLPKTVAAERPWRRPNKPISLQTLFTPATVRAPWQTHIYVLKLLTIMCCGNGCHEHKVWINKVKRETNYLTRLVRPLNGTLNFLQPTCLCRYRR